MTGMGDTAQNVGRIIATLFAMLRITISVPIVEQSVMWRADQMKTDIELLIEELNRLIRYDDAPIMKGYLISIDKLLLQRTIEALEGLQGVLYGRMTNGNDDV